jgi:YihY family inner membrane protein
MANAASSSPEHGRGIEAVVRRIDAFQRRHRPTAMVFAVIKKFGDDRGGSLAALLAYYGFLAVFPLLLFLITILGYVLGSHPGVVHDIQNSALRDFPVIGTQLNTQIHPLRGSGVALAVGLLGLLWGSLGVTQAAQFAMAQVWNIPNVARPSFWDRLFRGLLLFAALGLALLASTVLASVSTFGSAGMVAKVAGVVASLAVNTGLFVLAFRVLTPGEVPLGSLVPGAVLAGVAWSLLQALGGYLVGHQLRHASQVYGTFATVLGLLSWLYLGAVTTLYAAEFNVVKARRLWPRSMVQPPLTEADRRAMAAIALQEERRPEQDVRVSFDPDHSP